MFEKWQEGMFEQKVGGTQTFANHDYIALVSKLKILLKHQVDEMSSWWNVKLMKCQVYEMWSRLNVK